MNDELYQNTDNVITSPVSDKETGDSVPASSFTDAQYLLADINGNIKVSLSLGSGIEVIEEKFVIRIEDDQIGSEIVGRHYHQLVAWNSSGDKLPPLFSNQVNVIRVFSAPEVA